MLSRVTYLLRAMQYEWTRRSQPIIEFEGKERLTVILLSYRRIENMKFIAADCLRLPYVERVVISNNNPEFVIGDWINIEDSRLVLIDQRQRTLPGVRFELAREFGGKLFFCIDDDLFLSPKQLHQLFLTIIANPDAPLGIHGQDVRLVPFSFSRGWKRTNRQVDILNRFYAFTAEHLEQYFRLLTQLGSPCANDLGSVEDILLSLSGTQRPTIHDVGRYFNCLTEARTGVALWSTEDHFYDKRREVFLALSKKVPVISSATADTAFTSADIDS